jgi:tetratricopeptide (TPR) repeat protein
VKSRLLHRLEAQVRSAEDRTTWARSLCRQASHLARQGDGELARHAIGTVRKEFGTALEPEVAAWLMLAEGILMFVEDRIDAARDRIVRARGICVSYACHRALPACAAWLSSIEFNRSRYSEMAAHAREALTQAAVDDHQARARACLVIADAWHFSGSFEASRPWYDATRLHATSEGDESTVSAMLHNMAAYRAGNVCLADAIGERLPDEARRASLEAASATNYDCAVGTKSFRNLIPRLSAQLLIADREFAQAMKVLSHIDPAELPARLRAVHYADKGVCALNLGDKDAAEALGRQAIARLDSAVEDDDSAYVGARLSALFIALGDEELSLECSARADAALKSHRSTQTELRSILLRTCDEIRQVQPGHR